MGEGLCVGEGGEKGWGRKDGVVMGKDMMKEGLWVMKWDEL